MAADILIVDDEIDIRELIGGILEDEGYEARLAHDSTTALEQIEQRRPSLCILDIWLQGSDLGGLELLEVVKEAHPNLPVIIISGHGNIETAVSAIKKGAYDYIEKPFKSDRLILLVSRALEASRLKRENEALRQRTGEDDELIGNSTPMRQLRQSLKKIAPTNSRVMIFGENGSGKEKVARTLHSMSHRTESAFVVLSAATMAPEDIEQRLFGTEDAETGEARVGLLEEAHGGTLYIDEVADMPMETQGKVLRVLVEQQFKRVGGDTLVKVDVRVVSSTARDLDSLIKNGAFREDLFHRLNVVPLNVPALNDRRDDIPGLIKHFTQQYSVSSGRLCRAFGDDAIAVLQTFDWRGNVRQLRNNIERVLIMLDDDAPETISASMLPQEVEESGIKPTNGASLERIMTLPLREAREVFERDYLEAQVARFSGNISKTASFIGMERSALHRKLKLLGMIGGKGEEQSL